MSRPRLTQDPPLLVEHVTVRRAEPAEKAAVASSMSVNTRVTVPAGRSPMSHDPHSAGRGVSGDTARDGPIPLVGTRRPLIAQVTS